MATSAIRLTDLPDAVLAHLFDGYLASQITDLFSLSRTCRRFAAILLVYGVWHRRAKQMPIVASSRPNGRRHQIKTNYTDIADTSIPLRITNYLASISSSQKSAKKELAVRVLYRFGKKQAFLFLFTFLLGLAAPIRRRDKGTSPI
jgi:hypothetical protein